MSADTGTHSAPDVEVWIAEIKAQPSADGIGMILAHRGIVRGTTRAGDPVSKMMLSVDRDRLADVLDQARAWEGVVAVRAWVNEGLLVVGDEIMSVVVAGDIREHVFGALQRLVGTIKTEVVAESEIP